MKLENKPITNQEFYDEGYQDGFTDALVELLNDLRTRSGKHFEADAGIDFVIELIGDDYLK